MQYVLCDSIYIKFQELQSNLVTEDTSAAPWEWGSQKQHWDNSGVINTFTIFNVVVVSQRYNTYKNLSNFTL